MTSERERKGFPKAGCAIVFVAILLTLVIPGKRGSLKVHAEAQLTAIQAALITYREEYGAYPQLLTHLVQPPPEAKRQRPIMTRDGLIDSWGEPFVYELISSNSQPPYRLLSKGSDRLRDTEGDIVADVH